MKLRLALILAVAVIALGAAVMRMVPFARLGGSRVVAVLPRADGMREGATVTYLGLEIGRVERLRIHDGRVIAELRVYHDEVELRRGDTLRLRTLGLLGDRILDIVPGPRAAPRLGATDTLVAAKPPEIPMDAISEEFLRAPGRDSGRSRADPTPPGA